MNSKIANWIVCGRQFEKNIIVSRLLAESDGDGSSSSEPEMGISHPVIISIFKVGGSGKATLAQLVFNDERVKNHFDKTIWISVSASDWVRVAQAIIQEAGGTVVHDDNPELSRAVQVIMQMLTGGVVDDMPGWHAFQNSLSKSVEGNRFLLVLEDVRNEKSSLILNWPFLLDALKSGARGSKVLVTTRSSRSVTNIMNMSYDHDLDKMDILSDDD